MLDRLRLHSLAIWTAVASVVGRDELTLLAGLGLVAAGFAEFWRPGAFLFPGLVLVWVALPTRHGFVHRSAATAPKGRD